MLALVAPSTMTAEQQTLWLAAAVDALQDIRADEVAKVSAEVRRSVQRHNQIVPKIADLVAENRKRAAELSRAKAENEAWRSLPRPKKHIADRDRRYFSADDWAELNVWLESQGATARYRTDGSRYTVQHD